MDAEADFIREWCPDEDDADFLVKVRIKITWDEGHFLRMERTASALLDALEHDRARLGKWRFTFTEVITMLRHLLLHPGFLAKNKLSMSNEEYRKYIEERVERFEALRRRYEAISGA